MYVPCSYSTILLQPYSQKLMKFYPLLYLWLLLTGTINVLAQNTDKYTDAEIVYYKEKYGGLKIHTRGWGINYNTAKIQNIYKKKIWQFELQELKHPKENRRASVMSTAGASLQQRYIYGKQNNFYNINVLYGKERVLSQRGRKNPVTISYRYLGGASLGLLKPYYLRLYYQNETENFRDEPYNEQNALRFLDPNSIYSASGFYYGFNALKLRPGIVGKAAMVFEWSRNESSIKGVEIGAMLNIYPQNIPIMVVQENNKIFSNLYLQFLFGSRK